MKEDLGKSTIPQADVIALEDKEAGIGIVEDIRGREHAFVSPVDAAQWRAIYDKANYEGRHRFDPSIKWTKGEEKRLVRKVIRSDKTASSSLTKSRSWIFAS